MKKSLFFSLIASFFTVSLACAQKLDLSFHSPLPIRAAYINAIQPQPDGKVLLGGDINFFGTQRVHNLIRLNADGTLDDTFVYMPADDFIITHLALTATADIIAVARKYDAYRNIHSTTARLMKLAADGTVIAQVASEQFGDPFAVDADGKILIGAGTLVRYNNDLTPDAAFNENLAVDAGVTAVALSGNQIIIAGSFSHVSDVPKNGMARLNADGTLDHLFDVGSGTEDHIGALTVQPDGKILLGECYINSFNGQPARGMLRLNPDGSVDTSFNPPAINGAVSKAYVTADGIYAAAFLYASGETKDRVFRLTTDSGALDATFSLVTLDQFGAFSCRMGFSNAHLLVNNTQAFGNVYGLSKVNTEGIFDDTFLPPVSRYGTIKLADVFQGKMFVAGDFIRMNGVETYGIARLSLDGALDESFQLQKNYGEVRQLNVLDDGNILVTTYKNFFKLDEHGNESPDFSWSPFKRLYQVVKFEVLPDGKIMVADPNLIYRLHPDGSEDPSFDVGGLCCMSSTAFDFDMQGDKVIYGSAFSELGGVQVNRLARLTPDGKVDAAFDTGSGPDDMVRMIKVLNNNEIVVGGFFDTFDGRDLTLPLVKLSADGKIDDVFYNNLQANPALPWSVVFARKVEQLGSTIYFQDQNGIYAIGLDGNVDTDFNIPAVVSAVSDIITFNDTPAGGRMHAQTGLLFAMGNFRVGDSPAFVLKMEVEAAAEEEHVTTGIENRVQGVNAFPINVYPQPVTGRLRIKVSQPPGTYQATVSDLSGKTHLKTTVIIHDTERAAEVDVQNLPPGFFVLEMTGQKGRSGFVKFLKAGN